MTEIKNRKIIQIERVVLNPGHSIMDVTIYALCDDGSLWSLKPAATSPGAWVKLQSIPQGRD